MNRCRGIQIDLRIQTDSAGLTVAGRLEGSARSRGKTGHPEIVGLIVRNRTIARAPKLVCLKADYVTAGQHGQVRNKHAIGFFAYRTSHVVLIIGILGFIVIPQFSAQRTRGFEATLKADLRNAAAAEEAYFAQHQVYKAGPLPNIALPGYNKSTEISGMDAVVGTNTYVLTATHSNCAAIIWTYTTSSGAPSGPDGP